MKSFLQLYIIFLFLTSQLLFSQKYGYNEEIQVNSNYLGHQLNPQITVWDSNIVIGWSTENYLGTGSRFGEFAQLMDSNGKKVGEEFPVNDYLEEQYSSDLRILTLDNNKLLTSWVTKDASGTGIFAKIFEKDHHFSKIFQVNSFEKGTQDAHKILRINDERFLFCWDSFGQDNSGEGLFGQIFNFSGEKIGDEFQINSFTLGDQYRQNLCLLENNNFVICWGSREGLYEKNGSIFLQIFSEAGIKVSEEIQIDANVTQSGIKSPIISRINNNRFIICWEIDNYSDTKVAIFAQIFNNNGEEIGEKFKVHTSMSDYQLSPSILKINDQKFIVCWSRFGNDSSGLYAQLFDINGNRLGEEFRVNSDQYLSNIGHTIKMLNDNCFIICWMNRVNAISGLDIFAQIFDRNFCKIGEVFRINTFTNYDQSDSKIAVINNEKFILCWESDEQDGAKAGIFAKIFKSYPIKHNLLNFALSKPNIDETIDTAKPKFNWQYPSDQHINFQWEIKYELYISEDESFTNPIVITGITDTTYQIDTLAAGQTYFWKVLAKNYYGDSLWSSNVNGFFIDHGATDVEETEETLPTEFVLEQNYPNPFNPATTIKYKIPVAALSKVEVRNVNLEIFNTLGQKIKTLVNQPQQAGTYEVEFQAYNLPSGVYYFRLQTGDYSETKKMMLLR